MIKKCSKCGEEKTTAKFSKNRSQSDGLTVWCKECHRIFGVTLGRIRKKRLVEHLGGKSHDPIYSEQLEYQRNWHYMWSLFYYSKKHYGILDAYKKTFKKFCRELSGFACILFRDSGFPAVGCGSNLFWVSQIFE